MKPKNGKLSVAFLYDDSLDGHDGVAQYVKTLGTWYSKQGHQVTYLVGESKTDEWSGGVAYSLARNLKVKWGGNNLSISLIPKRKLIKRVISDNSFDVIHVQVPYSPFMAQQVINRAKTETAILGTVHVYPSGPLAVLGSRLLKYIYGRSWRRIDLLASVSSAAQSYAKIAFKAESIVVPNVVDLGHYKKVTAQRNNQKKTIVFLGRLVKRKGLAYLLRAFAEINDIDNAELIIAGKGPDFDNLQKLAYSLGIEKNTKFLGFVQEKDKPKLLASADIACFPSLYGESFGIVLIEAMAAGAGVVIGGNNEGYSTVLKNCPDALFDPKDTKSFARLLNVYLNDQMVAKSMHDIQQKEIKKFDVNVVGRRWEKLYHEAIAKRVQTSDN